MVGLGIIAVKTNKEETAFELKRHWLKLVQGVAWTDQERDEALKEMAMPHWTSKAASTRLTSRR